MLPNKAKHNMKSLGHNQTLGQSKNDKVDAHRQAHTGLEQQLPSKKGNSRLRYNLCMSALNAVRFSELACVSHYE